MAIDIKDFFQGIDFTKLIYVDPTLNPKLSDDHVKELDNLLLEINNQF